MYDILLFALIVALGINFGIYFRFNAKKRSAINNLFLKVKQLLPDDAFDSIIIINPSISSDIEKMLSHLSKNWIILYNGPEWLFNIKKRKLGERCLLLNEVITDRKVNLFNNSVIFQKKRNKYLHIFEVEQFIKYLNYREAIQLSP
jgi:hypothetical protein